MGLKLCVVDYQFMNFQHVPSLPLAYIVGKCKEDGLNVNIVEGFVGYLKDMLLGELDGIFSSIEEYKLDSNNQNILFDYNVRTIPILKIKSYIRDYGESGFKELLKEIYNAVTSKDVSNYLPVSKDHYDIVMEIMQIFKNIGLLENNLYHRILDVKPDIVYFFSPRVYENSIKRVILRLKEETELLVGASGFIRNNELHYGDIQGVDCYVFKSGEVYSVQKLFDIASKNKTNISNIWIRKGNNKFIKNRIDEKTNFKEIPSPDFSEQNLDLYHTPYRILPLETSFGCSWNQCVYCGLANSTCTESYFPLDIERIMERIINIRDIYKTKYIAIIDLNLEKSHAEKISGKIVEDEIDDIYFYCNSRFSKDFTRDTWKLMYKAGFRCVARGVESGSQRILNLMQKGTNKKDIRRILRDSHNAGLYNVCCCIIGFPTETHEDIYQTIEFLEENHEFIDSCKFRVLDRSPGKLFTDPKIRKKYGIALNESNLTGFKVSDGPQPNESSIIYERIEQLRDNKQIKLDNGRLIMPYAPKNPARRTLLLFQAYYKKISDKDAQNRINYDDYLDLFPVKRAFAREMGGYKLIVPSIYPISALDNMTIRADDAEYDIFLQLNGKQSNREILAGVGLKRGGRGKLEQKMKTFYNNLLEKEYIMFFENRLE